MPWRDSLRPAAFRGVPFLIDPGAVPVARGRRLHRHEYPGRDLPYAEDLGRKGRTISYSAFVVGADALSQAARLVSACEDKAEPGTLVDPWRGEMTVTCEDCTDAYDVGLADVVGFHLVFIETQPPAFPSAATSLTAALDSAGLAAKAAALTDFAATFSFAGVASFVADAAGDLVGEVGGLMGDALGGILAAGSPAAVWARALSQFAVDAADIIRDPASLAQRVYGLMDLGGISGLADIVQFPLTIRGVAQSFVEDGLETRVAASWSSYLPLIGWQPRPQVLVSTPSSRQQAANQDALAGLVRQAAVVEASRAAVRNAEADAAATAGTRTDAEPVFGSREQVIAARDTLVGHIDTVQQTAGDATFRALRSVRAELVRALTRLAPALPQLQTITPLVTTPAIVIAYQAFGDDPVDAAAKAEDIVARNGVPHPLFVAADSLQVLVA